MITLHNITKSFGSLQVLKGINLTIGKGEVVSIVGPSGAGKTTLLQIMGTLDTPDTGTITIDGTDVTQLKDKIRIQGTKEAVIQIAREFLELVTPDTVIVQPEG